MKKKEKKQTDTHTNKQMNEIHKMKKKEEIYKMKKMWLLMLSCKEAFIRFVFESPYSIFIFVLCPSPLHTSPVSFNFIRKKKTIMHYTLVKSLSFSLAYIYQIEEEKNAYRTFLQKISDFFGKRCGIRKNKTHKRKKNKFKYHASKTLLDCNWIDLFSKGPPPAQSIDFLKQFDLLFVFIFNFFAYVFSLIHFIHTW